MGLKFEYTDNLGKLFESSAVDPEEAVALGEEIDRFLKSQPQNEKRKDKKQRQVKLEKRLTDQTFVKELGQ